MTITTSYGSWSRWNRTDSPEEVCEQYTGGLATPEELAHLARAYRQAVNDSLPVGVSLNGNLFHGPHPNLWPADLATTEGILDIAAILETIDLGKIAVDLVPDNGDEGRYLYLEMATGTLEIDMLTRVAVRICCGKCGTPVQDITTQWRGDALPDRSAQILESTITDALAAHYAEAH